MADRLRLLILIPFEAAAARASDPNNLKDDEVIAKAPKLKVEILINFLLEVTITLIYFTIKKEMKKMFSKSFLAMKMS